MCGLLVSMYHEFEEESVQEGLDAISHRGPDDFEYKQYGGYGFGFVRLAIMDLTTNGNQPFIEPNLGCAVMNGEIYNYKDYKSLLRERGFQFHSESDCEILLPLLEFFESYEAYFNALDGEFATVLYDEKRKQLVAARDHLGIRPLFYGYSKQTGEIAFCSEMKGLLPFARDIQPFPPGMYYVNGVFSSYKDVSSVETISMSEEEACEGIRKKLEEAVEKRIHPDAPIGYLLSGGLDSSLVCSIAQRKSDVPIRTFAIGMETDPIDLKYAQQVADYLGTEHTEVILTKEDVLQAVRQVIWHLESYDITTVRASIGMFLVCKYIREHTDIKVLLTGEVSDEMFGYKYTDFAPDAQSFQEEAQKRVRELYFYDVLRADRCIAGNSLEARVPFSDYEFMKHVMSIDPKLKMNTKGMGKYLLRKAFEGTYLPDEILWREKAAFSDAVGHSLVDYLKAYADEKYSDKDLEDAKQMYTHVPPHTKEALLYREIFEAFYKNKSQLIPSFWMPNMEWTGEVHDPSARILSNYGASGL